MAFYIYLIKESLFLSGKSWEKVNKLLIKPMPVATMHSLLLFTNRLDEPYERVSTIQTELLNI